MTTDPICGKRIKERDPQRASELNGKIYYFCSKECKHQFDREQRLAREQLATASR